MVSESNRRCKRTPSRPSYTDNRTHSAGRWLETQTYRPRDAYSEQWSNTHGWNHSTEDIQSQLRITRTHTQSQRELARKHGCQIKQRWESTGICSWSKSHIQSWHPSTPHAYAYSQTDFASLRDPESNGIGWMGKSQSKQM